MPSRGILRLRLQTQRAGLAALRRFYTDTLELPVTPEGPATDRTLPSFTIRAGAPGIGTDITFEGISPPSSSKSPYYHFAFNIPQNRLAAAKAWLAPRCPILKKPDGSDEHHFASWNAHAFYFLDPAGNILEFIARHNLNNTLHGPAAQAPFSPGEILYASEIALVVDDVNQTARLANEHLGLGVFANTKSDTFAALGDDHRLLIVVKRARPWNSGDGRKADVWPVSAELHADRAGTMKSEPLGFEVVAR